jgi:ankyrin repeat protein
VRVSLRARVFFCPQIAEKARKYNHTQTNNQTKQKQHHKKGHYKFPPAEIPALLVQSGADLEAKDAQGRTALQVSLLSGWQNIAKLLLDSDADTSGVATIKGSVTCPDCKRLIAEYKL